MTPELLNLLTPEERAAWALCEGATPGPWVDMTSAGPDGGAFNGEIRAALSFTHICSDVPGDDRENDRAFIAESRDALPAALTTIATLRAELRAVADLLQEVGVLGIASTMDAVVVSGQPSARDLLTWAAKAMDAWPEERQTLRAELNGILDDARVLAAAVGVPADSDAPMTEALRRVEAQRDALAMAEEREREMVIARDILRETLAEQQRAFVIGLDLAQRTADAEIAELRARLTTGIGLPLGVNDRDGNPVHVGDTLAFDGWEWSRICGAPDHIYTVEYSGGQVLVDGTIGDIRHYCRVVKRWDAPKESP